jgi:hypothetical protein
MSEMYPSTYRREVVQLIVALSKLLREHCSSKPRLCIELGKDRKAIIPKAKAVKHCGIQPNGSMDCPRIIPIASAVKPLCSPCKGSPSKEFTPCTISYLAEQTTTIAQLQSMDIRISRGVEGTSIAEREERVV